MPGWFGLIADVRPPTAPTVAARLTPNGLYLTWQPATDDGTIASYAVLRNGKPVLTLTAAARRAAIRRPGAGAQTVYRVQATDARRERGQDEPPVVAAREEAAGRPPTRDAAVGVRALRLSAAQGPAARGGAEAAARVVLALGRVARAAVPAALRSKEKSRRRGGTFVHPADRPIRACTRLSRSTGLRPTRAPRPAGSGEYDGCAGTARAS